MSASTSSVVVVPRGTSVRIALAVPLDGPLAPFGTAAVNGVPLALDDHPRVRGFPVVPVVFDAPCSPPADATAARAITADATFVGVVGPMCSGRPCRRCRPTSRHRRDLADGDAAGTGSVRADDVRRTVVDDTSFDAWHARVATVNRAFRARYAASFGQAPGFFVADLAYDATLVMLDSLERASTIGGGSLVIDRAGLAAAVRKTDGLHGVTCTITIAANGDRLDDPVALDRCADEA